MKRLDPVISAILRYINCTVTVQKCRMRLRINLLNPLDAVMVEGDGDKEVIAETLRAGYRYEGELIRPALVKVEKQ